MGKMCGARLPSSRNCRTYSCWIPKILRQTIIISPNSSWSGQLGHSCQCLHALRNHTPAVPHLRLIVVHPDVRVGRKSLLPESCGRPTPFQEHKSHGRRRGKQTPSLHRRSVQTQRKQERHEGIALLPSSIVGCLAHSLFHPPTDMLTGGFRRSTVQRGGFDPHHCVPGDQIVRPNSINGHHCGTGKNTLSSKIGFIQ